MKAKMPQQQIMEEPPWLMNGRVTPVRGRISVMPKMLRAAWKSKRPAPATAATE